MKVISPLLRLVTLLCLPFSFISLPCLSMAAPDNFSSRPLAAKKATGTIVIDGKLDETVWKSAPVATPFIDNITEKPTEEATEAWLLYDEKYLYVAFYCHDSQPDKIVAREIRYGAGLGNDDSVSFSIDPYYTKAFGNASRFNVNPLGTQNENIAGGRAAKREWRGVWQAASQRVADGWTCEMRIPWNTLNFSPSAKPITMGINFSRSHSRPKVESTWSSYTRTGKPELIGRWEGVEPPKNLRVTPLQSLVYVSPEAADGENPTVHAGVDLRYRPNAQMTGVLSVLPDFRNIERSVEGIQFTRSERFLGETRPFFVEGRRFFPGLFYSPRVHEFDVGAKAFGKINRELSFGLLTVERSLDYNATAGKLSYSFAQHGNVTLFGTMRRGGGLDSHEGLGFNGAFQSGQWGVGGGYRRAREGQTGGANGNAELDYSSPHWFGSLEYSSVDPDYRPSLGFVSFTDQRGYASSMGYSNEYRKGPLRSFSAGVSGGETRHYNGDFYTRDASANISLTTRNDYDFSLGRSLSRFEGAHDRTYNANLTGNSSDRFRTWNVGYSWGVVDDHDYHYYSFGATRRLFKKLDISLNGSILRHEQNLAQYIVTVGWEFDARRAISGRIVAGSGTANGYITYRNAGGVGQDLFLILGDPSATRFTQRIALKWVYAN